MQNEELKRVSIANFNVVFLEGSEEYPLLDYFDKVVMPAFTSGIIKSSGDSEFLFMDVTVEKDMSNEYILTGLLVKSTVLEVRSMFDENGNLVNRDDIYPTAPFSTFVIYLKNHRMILVENQKGSPNLSSFRSTAKYVLDTFVVKKNHELKEVGEILLPIPLVNIVGIPPKGGMAEQLKGVEKITLLKLKFYPLNGDGDIDLSDVMGGISKDLRRLVGSDRGEVMFRSPKNIKGVINVIEQAEGTVEPIVIATFPGHKGETVIRIDQVSERRRMRISGKNRKEELSSIIMQSQEIESINYKSKENSNIYSRNINKIITFFKNKE